MTTTNLTGFGAAQGGANIGGSDVGGGPGPDVMAASTLDSTTVITYDGEVVGKIKDNMLDVRSGRVGYAVLTSGGFLGMGDTLRAIPRNALTLDTDQKVFRVDITAGSIKSEPGFDKDHWPSMADLNWGTSMYQYYNCQPYGSTALDPLTGSTVPVTGTNPVSRDPLL